MKQINLSSLQNEKARYGWGEFDQDQCSICGRKLGNKKPTYIHYLTNGNITNADENQIPEDLDQGCFPVGPECFKKVEKAFKEKAI